MDPVRAIDVVPYRWALWCAIEDGEPFANPIVHCAWIEDGERILFGLDSHNSFSAAPDAILDLVRVHAWEPADADARHAQFLASRPVGRQSIAAADAATRR